MLGAKRARSRVRGVATRHAPWRRTPSCAKAGRAACGRGSGSSACTASAPPAQSSSSNSSSSLTSVSTSGSRCSVRGSNRIATLGIVLVLCYRRVRCGPRHPSRTPLPAPAARPTRLHILGTTPYHALPRLTIALPRPCHASPALRHALPCPYRAVPRAYRAVLSSQAPYSPTTATSTTSTRRTAAARPTTTTWTHSSHRCYRSRDGIATGQPARVCRSRLNTSVSGPLRYSRGLTMSGSTPIGGGRGRVVESSTITWRSRLPP